jgi:hypothetical protein
MLMYGEWLLVAIDGGTDNYSSILVFNRLGWHEFYRAPAVGMRITGLYIQSMPGNYVDRLWFNEGADICHCHIDLNPYGNSNFRYTFSGWVDMASLYGSIPDIEKFYHKIRIAADDLATGDHYISTAPRDPDGWSNGGEPPTGETIEKLWGDFESSPVSEITIDEFWGMATFTLKRLQVHLALHTVNRDTSPVFRAIVIDYMEHLPVAWTYTMRLLTTDRRKSLTGEIQEDAAEDDLNTLLTYANSGEPIRIYTPFAMAGEFPAKLTAITDIESVGYTRRGDKERYVFTLTAVDA